MTGPGTYQLRVLHISDLHIHGPREGDRPRRQRVLGENWLKNLAVLREDGDFDIVAFTGDVANWGRKDEYDELVAAPRSDGVVEHWLDETLAAAGCDRSRLYVVPGNHDVDRSVYKAAWSKIRRAWDKVGAEGDAAFAQWLLRGGNPPAGFSASARKKLIARRDAYFHWLRDDLRLPDLLPGARCAVGYQAALSLAHRAVKLPFSVHVIGLDSAWLAGDDHDAGKLRLTDSQILTHCTQPDGTPLTGFRLALVHHPLADLADRDRSRRLLQEYGVGLVLSGHMHSTAARALVEPDGQLLDVATGCLYQYDRYKNGVTAMTLTLDGAGTLQSIDFRFRAWSENGFWYDDNSLYKGTVNGRLRWPDNHSVRHSRAPRPTRVVDLIARDAQLTDALTALEAGRPFVLTGMPGVGKTQVARAVEQRWRSKVAVRVELDPRAAVSEPLIRALVAAELGPRVAALPDPELHGVLLERDALVIVENVDSVRAATAVVDFAARFPGVPLLTTARYRAWSSWGVAELAPLEESDAADFLRAEVGTAATLSLDEERRLHVELAGLPLAISLAAGHLRRHGSVDRLLNQLLLERGRLAPRAPDDPLRLEREAGDLHALIAVSHSLLLDGAPAPWRDAFTALCSVSPAPFGRAFAGAATGLVDGNAGYPLSDLLDAAVDLSLLSEAGTGAGRRWSIHPLVLAYGRSDERTLLDQRINTWIRSTAAGPASAERTKRWQSLRDESTALAGWLLQASATVEAATLVECFHYIEGNGPLAAWLAAYGRVDLDAADPGLTFGYSRLLGRAGQADEAHRAAIALRARCVAESNQHGAALADLLLSEHLEADGKLDNALALIRSASEQLARLGDENNTALSVAREADILQHLGRTKEALALRLQRELPLVKKLNDDHAIASTAFQIARCDVHLKKFDEALRRLREEVLPVYAALGDVYSWAQTSEVVSNTIHHKALAQTPPSSELLSEAATIMEQDVLPSLRSLNAHGDIGKGEAMLARILLDMRRPADALAMCIKCEAAIVNSRDKHTLANMLFTKAHCLEDLGRPAEALALLRDRVVGLYQETNDPCGESTGYHSLVRLCRALGCREETSFHAAHWDAKHRCRARD